MDSRGQISAEYLFLMLIFLIILGTVTIPLVSNSITSSMNVSVASDAKIAVSTIANEVNVVYSNGPGSKRTVNVYFPQDTTIGYNNSQLTLTLHGVSYTNGTQRSVANASVPYTNFAFMDNTTGNTDGNIVKGWHKIQITWGNGTNTPITITIYPA